MLEVAAAVGLDIDQMKTDMKDSAINGDLDKNTKLGELLHITGTPAFVVGGQVATGARAEELPGADREGAGAP